ncbi:MAG: hypothetical protein IPQ08_06130 [Chitinophagaceae bacterium]|nr:hypothetical protein [Chitinophagaceae bacterium]
MDAKKVLLSGDILLSEVEWELSNYFIPKTYKHAAIYFNGLVYEAVTHGVRSVTLEEWLFKKDHVAIVRANFDITAPMLFLGKSFLDQNIGEPYDFSFKLEGTQSWYCSKYAYEFLLAMNPSFAAQFTLRETLGELTVKPDDFYLAKDKFTLIAKFN